VDECNKDQSKQIDLFIVHLRNQIKDVFEMERENYNKVFREIKEAYVRQFKRVSDSVTAVHKYYGKYCKYYNEALTLHVKQKSSSKDMYNKEMKYKQATSNLLHD
jgi:phage host-nuclease inhibitor protein Gam